MKKIIMAIALVGSMTSVSMVAGTVPAAAQGFNFSFDTGDVAMAYSDGYYDNHRTWHKWRNSREAREYRSRNREHYNHRRHRDSDGDGVPDFRDDHPNNPRRD